MVIGELQGNILLEKFELDDEEMLVARNLVGKYAEKIKRVTEYQQIKLEMRVHQKGKNKHFEIKAHLDYSRGRAVSENQDTNPFVAIDAVMEKLLNEVNHAINKK